MLSLVYLSSSVKSYAGIKQEFENATTGSGSSQSVEVYWWNTLVGMCVCERFVTLHCLHCLHWMLSHSRTYQCDPSVYFKPHLTVLAIIDEPTVLKLFILKLLLCCW